MKDMLAHLETLRAQISQCQRLQREAKNKVKRDIFRRLVARYSALARELEQAIAKVQSSPAESKSVSPDGPRHTI